MAEMNDLDKAFDQWLNERRDGLTLRQQFWLAFEAGANYVIEKIRSQSNGAAK